MLATPTEPDQQTAGEVADLSAVLVREEPLEHYDRMVRILKQPHLPALDGMRAVAVALVILFHFGLKIPGDLGVLIFFVLSGFLITWLLLKETDRWGSVSLKNFYIRRSLRIFPAFYAFAGLGILLLTVFKKAIVWPQVAAALLYVNNYYQALHGDPNTLFSHTWSLGIEEQFYLIWPSIFLLLHKKRTALVKFLVVTIVVVSTYRWISFLGLHVQARYTYEAFETRADSLAVGCLLAVLLWNGNMKRFFNWACSSQWLALISMSGLIVSATLGVRFGRHYRDLVGLGLEPLLVGICIPQFIAFGESPIGRWLNWSWMRRLGVLSYSMYLYQQAVVFPTKHLAADLPTLVQLLLAFGITVLCATLSYRFVEGPALQLKHKFSVV